MNEDVLRVKVGVVGATGAVGREIVRLLGQRRFPVSHLEVYASAESAGTWLEWEEDEIAVKALDATALRQCELVFSAVPVAVGDRVFKALAGQDTFLVDLSGAAVGAPVVVPEVNPDTIQRDVRAVVSPASPVPPLALVLDALRDVGIPVRAVVTVFAPASARGRDGMEELAQQTIGLLNQQDVPLTLFPQRLAFNLIPDVGGVPAPGAASALEGRLTRELVAVLDEPDLDVLATAVFVPLFSGQAASVVVEMSRPVSLAAVQEALGAAEGIEVVDAPEAAEYPLAGAIAEQDCVAVGRIRVGGRENRHVQLWLASDNLRKGSALNAVHIAERAIMAGVWASRVH